MSRPVRLGLQILSRASREERSTRSRAAQCTKRQDSPGLAVRPIEISVWSVKRRPTAGWRGSSEL